MEVIYCLGCNEYINADYYEFKRGIITSTMQSPPDEWMECKICGQKMSMSSFDSKVLEEKGILKLLNK